MSSSSSRSHGKKPQTTTHSYNLRSCQRAEFQRTSVQIAEDIAAPQLVLPASNHSPTRSSVVPRRRGRPPRGPSRQRSPASMSIPAEKKSTSSLSRRSCRDSDRETRSTDTKSRAGSSPERLENSPNNPRVAKAGTNEQSSAELPASPQAASNGDASLNDDCAHLRKARLPDVDELNNPPVVDQIIRKFAPKEPTDIPRAAAAARHPEFPRPINKAALNRAQEQRNAEELEKRYNWCWWVVVFIGLLFALLYQFNNLIWPHPVVPTLPSCVLGAVDECAVRDPRQKPMWDSLRNALEDYLRPPRSQSFGDTAVIPLGVVVLHENTPDGALKARAAITCLDDALTRLSSNKSWIAATFNSGSGGCFAFRDTAADAHTGEFIDHLKELRTRFVRGPFEEIDERSRAKESHYELWHACGEGLEHISKSMGHYLHGLLDDQQPVYSDRHALFLFSAGVPLNSTSAPPAGGESADVDLTASKETSSDKEPPPEFVDFKARELTLAALLEKRLGPANGPPLLSRIKLVTYVL